jgi:predicted O-linked N-acetylglucosamine transferase (SPINDLY family)
VRFDPAMNRHERRRAAVLEAKGRAPRPRPGEDPVAASVTAQNQRGVALHQRGDYDGAVKVFLEAAALAPDVAITHSNLGNTFQALGKLDMAVLCYRAAIERDRGFAAAWNNLANALAAQGKHDDALAHYRHAVSLEPDSAELLTNLGSALQRQGQLDEAAAVYVKAIEIDGSFAVAHNNLGAIMLLRGRFDEAAASLERATKLMPLAQAHHNLAEALQMQGRHEAAIASQRRANELRYDPARELTMATALAVIPASRDAIAADRTRVAANLDRLAGSALPVVDFDTPPPLVANFFLAYHGQNDVDLQRKLATVCLKMSPSLAYTAAHCRMPVARHGRRIRLGVVSSYAGDHTVDKLTRGLIERLARDRFEIVAFTTRDFSDDTLPGIVAAADRVSRLPRHLKEAQRHVEAEALDILLYPDVGMARLAYFLAYARLAPVQCVTWGHPVTTGLPNIDYYISSASLEPEGADAHYTERLARLSRLPTYYYRPEAPAGTTDRRAFGFDDGDVLYVCPQSLFKLHPDFDAIVADILRRDPRGRIVLLEGLSREWGERVLARLAPLVPDPRRRISLLPRMPQARFMDLLRVADVMLDPVHFGGGNSTYEALALGVPIVTWPGAFMRGRVTAACYRQMGVMDCVVDSAEAYAERAVRLANDRGFRDDVSARLLAAGAHLFEDVQAVAELQAFLEQAVAA